MENLNIIDRTNVDTAFVLALRKHFLVSSAITFILISR